MVTWTAIVISTTLRALSASSSSSLRSDLKQIRNCFFWLFIACTFMVVIGVILEEIKFRTAKSYVDAESEVFVPERRRKLATLGLWILVVGITGEGLFEMATSWTDGISEDFSNSLLLNAEALTGNAAKSATTARAELAAVKKETTALTADLKVASRQLDDLRSDTLALSPRWRLLQKGEDIFVKALKPFPREPLKNSPIHRGSG